MLKRTNSVTVRFHHLNAICLGLSAIYTCTIAIGSLTAVELVQGPHHCRRDRCLSVQSVEWHQTPRNICSSALHARHNSQLKIYGTTRTQWLTSSTWMTSDEKTDENNLLGYLLGLLFVGFILFDQRVCAVHFYNAYQ